jgi:microcystin degradation protein MlrC
MRLLTGSLIQESNTFSPLTSDLSFFRAGCLYLDDESLTAMAGKRTELGGFIAASQQVEAKLVPTLAAWAPSGGPMISRDFDWLAAQFLQRVDAAGPVDGVLLALHGAWVSEEDDDADGWLLSQVRQIVGPETPIVATLDLHANVTARMIKAADALVGFRTYPHVDMFETGERAARLLFRLLQHQVRPTMTVCKVPMLVPPENAQTADGPLAPLMDELVRLETQPHCLAASLFIVQPWLDVPELGCAIVLVADDQQAWAQEETQRLGACLWSRRHALRVPLVPATEAVARALAAPTGPIILVDSADGMSSGSPGDSTAILRALLAAQPQRLTLVTVVDPEAARTAAAADGRQINLVVGGRLDPGRHQPVAANGRARRVPNGRVTFAGGIGDGLTADMGTAAVLEVGALRIVLMERPVHGYDPALYRAVGLEPSAAHIVVVKSPNNFRWAYRDIAQDWIYVDAPGASTPRLESLRFVRAPRPFFPLDDWSWHPGVRSE